MAVNSKRLADRDDEHQGSVAFEVYKPFDPAALDAELSTEMGWRKDSGLVIEGDPSQASQKGPVLVWVARGADVDTSSFKKVVTAHEVPEVTDDSAEITDLLALAAGASGLSVSDMQRALRLLLRRAERGN